LPDDTDWIEIELGEICVVIKRSCISHRWFWRNLPVITLSICRMLTKCRHSDKDFTCVSSINPPTSL
jgi:hypothetical protein